MTGKRSRGDASSQSEPTEAGKSKKATVGDAKVDAGSPDAAAAKASVHEAIGKLIGDDDERRRGTEKKTATGVAPRKPGKPKRT